MTIFLGAYSSVRLERTPDKGEVIGSTPIRPTSGGVAQLGERLLCKQEVIGSIPFTSTRQSSEFNVQSSRLIADIEPLI